MLTWLAGWFGGFARSVAQPVVDMVRWAVHGLASVILGVFNSVDDGWADFLNSARALLSGAGHFATYVFDALRGLYRVLIPRLWHYITDSIRAVNSVIRWVWDHTRALVHQALATVSRWLADLWKLVIRDVYDPLKAWADTIYTRLIKWGYTAWWWITHLDRLAESMIFHIAASLEKHAWELANMLGTFFLAVLLRNVKRVLLLVESVVSAVL